MPPLSRLLDMLFPPRERALRARSVSYETLVALMQPVRIISTAPAAHALLPYRHPLVQAAITEAKFNDARRAQDALGAVLAEYLQDVVPKEERVVLIPVPISAKRLRERGYNQAERICRAAQRCFKALSVETGLVQRIRDTPPQTSLGGTARRSNLQGAFTVARAPDPHTLYIVIDDVITTGATLSAMLEALRASGAARILPIALAHSP